MIPLFGSDLIPESWVIRQGDGHHIAEWSFNSYSATPTTQCPLPVYPFPGRTTRKISDIFSHFPILHMLSPLSLQLVKIKFRVSNVTLFWNWKCVGVADTLQHPIIPLGCFRLLPGAFLVLEIWSSFFLGMSSHGLCAHTQMKQNKHKQTQNIILWFVIKSAFVIRLK